MLSEVQMTKEQPFSGTFKFDKETKNTVRYAEEAEGRRPVVGMVYVEKYELPKPFPKRIRVTVEPQNRFWGSSRKVSRGGGVGWQLALFSVGFLLRHPEIPRN